MPMDTHSFIAGMVIAAPFAFLAGYTIAYGVLVKGWLRGPHG